MKHPKFLSLLVAVVIGISAGPVVQAYDIAWSVGGQFKGATGHQNISTAGVHIQAISFGETMDRSVDTGTEVITFEGLFKADTAPNTFDGTPFETDITPGSNSLSWNDIMRWQNWSTTNTGDFQLTGLTIGNTYQVEIFVWDVRVATGGGQQQFWSDEEGNDSGTFTYIDGFSTIGTFVADASTELILGTMVSPTDDPVVTGYSLRQLAEIPEPGSMMALIALGCVVAVRRRRR